MSVVTHEREIDYRNGRFRSVVTHLEMLQPPTGPPPRPPAPDVQLERWHRPDLDEYLALFRRIGDPWLWFGRLLMESADIEYLIQSPDYAVWRLWTGGEVAGLCELNPARPDEVKVEYFGLAPEHIGRGLGGFFLRSMVHEAWAGNVHRVWLHTCSEDHPDALAVYQRVGFRPFHQETEWVPDPRVHGLLPREAGTHVPMAE